MVVVEQLAAKLQIQFAPKLGDPVPDVLGLGGQVFLVVKAYFDHALISLSIRCKTIHTPVFYIQRGSSVKKFIEARSSRPL